MSVQLKKTLSALGPVRDRRNLEVAARDEYSLEGSEVITNLEET